MLDVASRTLVQAITDGLRTAMERDSRVMLLGEDIARNGGVYRATEGLLEAFGEDRVVDTPLSEAGILGTAVGLAANGFRPVRKFSLWPLSIPDLNRLFRISRESECDHAAVLRPRWSYASRLADAYGRQSFIQTARKRFLHTRLRLKVVAPSNPYDAKRPPAGGD